MPRFCLRWSSWRQSYLILHSLSWEKKLENIVEHSQEMDIITEILNKLNEVLSQEECKTTREELINIKEKILRLDKEGQKASLSLVKAKKTKKELEATKKKCRKNAVDARRRNEQLHEQVALLERCRNNFASSEKDDNVQGQQDCNECE